MRRFRTALSGAILLGALFLAAPLSGGRAQDCMDLSARLDNDVHSPSGVRVFVTGRNRCGEDIDGSDVSFKVTAVGSGGSVIGHQRGRFGGTVAGRASVESIVFVVCDPERVRSVSVKSD